MVEIDLLTSYSCKNLLTISVTFKEYFIVYYSNTQDRLLYPLNISVSFECFTINVFQISKVSEAVHSWPEKKYQRKVSFFFH